MQIESRAQNPRHHGCDSPRNGGAMGRPYASLYWFELIRHRSCKYEVTRFDGYYQTIIHNRNGRQSQAQDTASLRSRHANSRLGYLDPHALEAAQKGNECFRVVGGEDSADL